MTTETFFIGGAPKSFFQPQTAGQDAFAMVYSSKRPAGAGRWIVSTSWGYAQRLAEGTRQKTSTQYMFR
jgi:hypothetical protein